MTTIAYSDIFTQIMLENDDVGDEDDKDDKNDNLLKGTCCNLFDLTARDIERHNLRHLRNYFEKLDFGFVKHSLKWLFNMFGQAQIAPELTISKACPSIFCSGLLLRANSLK